jgi:steroid 5-alpha reductase family enzyme
MTLWCVRLVYNYWRKGGYYGQHEDYRWVHVRAMFGYPERKVIYHIFNFAFTAFFQIFLLMSLALPLWHIQNNPKQEPLNVMDGVVFAGLVAFLTLEIVADQQQWNYQTNKYKWLGQGKAAQTRSTSGGLSYTSEEIEDFKRGFHIKGLFRYTRHPNFFAEISIWWTVYLFSLSAQFSHLRANFAWSALVNYSIVGAVFLNLLFLGSTHLTEKITLSKYPEYAKYQKRVSSLIPFITTYEPNKSK